jgi:hypothetical protein
MAPEDVGKTALITKSGLYEWNVMPFGLKNATSTFTRTMAEVFKDVGDSFLKIFVDDLNIHSIAWQDHLQHLGTVLSRLREVNLKLNPSKCCFAAGSIVFLGHVVSREGTRPDPNKIDVVRRFPVPTNIANVRSFLGLTGYYRKYIKGYSKMAGPLFELTKKDVVFIWDQERQSAFDDLRRALVQAPVLVRPNFQEPFCLDVDWSTRGVGAILSQKEGRFEKVIAYASKALTEVQRRFHPMEGECYALIWGILHFRQYLHRTHFTLRTDHKPLEWLATVSDAHGRRGRWIDLLQDFSFKIVHRAGLRHANADALSRNPVGQAVDDEDFRQEIQDDPVTQQGMGEAAEKVLAVRPDQHLEWFEKLRESSGLTEHHRRGLGKNHGGSLDPHHLFMVDAVNAIEEGEETNQGVEKIEVVEDEELDATVGEQKTKKSQVKYYNRQQQLELVLAAQELFGIRGYEIETIVEEEGTEVKGSDIWQDATCMALLREGMLPEMIKPEEGKRAKKRVEHYCWKEQKLFFKGLYVPRPEERRSLVVQMHEDLGHFGEQKILTEICQRYFWHHRTEDVKLVVRSCQQCQLVKSEGNIRSGDQELKSIPVCDLFYKVAMDTAGPLPETKAGNKYILVAIDHYSKWCEAKVVADHGAKTAAKFLEDDLICRYGVPNFILIDNGGEWGAEFEVMCKDYAIQH